MGTMYKHSTGLLLPLAGKSVKGCWSKRTDPAVDRQIVRDIAFYKGQAPSESENFGIRRNGQR